MGSEGESISDGSITHSNAESENDSDGSGHYSQKPASRQKTKRHNVGPKRVRSTKSYKDTRSTQRTLFSPSASLLGKSLTAAKDKPKSHINPLFLRLSHWIEANPDEVSVDLVFVIWLTFKPGDSGDQ